MSGALILVRHGESEFNAKNLFTGLRDVGLTSKGEAEAERLGLLLAEDRLPPDIIYTSSLRRTVQSGLLIKASAGGSADLISSAALNERDYGDLTGLNKDEAQKRWGNDQVRRWRRSYREPPPGGESLRDTVGRVLPYFVRQVLPNVLEDRTVIEDEIAEIEFRTGEAILYRFSPSGRVREKTVLATLEP
jgi:2,3-bisphosphoglycerate-dependent phosphoglycerate mutase